mgnify:CR=1 FL=1
MAEFQITSWRSIPSMVAARDGADTVKVSLSSRFQLAIDEAAMQAGATDADAYLDGWVRSDWQTRDGGPTAVAEAVARELEATIDDEALNGLISKETA